MNQNDPVFYLHNFQPTAIDSNIIESYLYLSHEIAANHPQITHAPKSKISLFSKGSFTNKGNLPAIVFTLTKVSGQLMNKRKQKKLQITEVFFFLIILYQRHITCKL